MAANFFAARAATTEGFEFPFLPLNKDLYIFEEAGQGVFAAGVNGFVNGEETFTFYHDYYWIYILTILAGFFTAYGIGANDVANAFATSVGSKALTVTQAVIIAAIFEFSGAFFLGAAVTDTVRKGIVNVKLFQGHEDWLMIGMCCSVLVVGVWLLVATSFELPVSTTHSMVGAIIGFSLACPGGVDNVAWSKVIEIIISWFASPVLSGSIAAVIFVGVRTTILRSENSFNRTMIFFPLLVFFTVTINVFFILKKGGKNLNGADKWPIEQSVGVGAATGAVVGVLVFVVLVPIMRKRLEGISEDDELVSSVPDKKGDIDYVEDPVHRLSINDVALGRIARFREGTNVHRAITENAKVGGIHANAEVFGTRTERAFGYLQVFTAIFDSFSHGANDVANSIGPVASVWSVFNVGVGVADAKKVEFPTWILAIGGAGIVFGLATYGYKIMSAIGVKLVKVTPTRGFSIELGAAFVIVAGSYLALPLSTTHCQVGATIGVGLCESNWREAVNFKLLAKVFAGWVFTLVIAGCGCAVLFSFVVYGPSINPPVSNTNCLIYQGVHLKSNSTGSITLPFMASPNTEFDGSPVERTLTIIAGYNVDLAQQQPKQLQKSKDQNDLAQGYVLKDTDYEQLIAGNQAGIEAIWEGARGRYLDRTEPGIAVGNSTFGEAFL